MGRYPSFSYKVQRLALVIQATGKLKAVTTVKTPLTLPAEATFEDYLAAVVEPDQVTEVLAKPFKRVRLRRCC